MLHIYHFFQQQVFKFRFNLQTFLKEYPCHVAKLHFFSDLNNFFSLFFLSFYKKKKKKQFFYVL